MFYTGKEPGVSREDAGKQPGGFPCPASVFSQSCPFLKLGRGPAELPVVTAHLKAKGSSTWIGPLNGPVWGSFSSQVTGLALFAGQGACGSAKPALCCLNAVSRIPKCSLCDSQTRPALCLGHNVCLSPMLPFLRSPFLPDSKARSARGVTASVRFSSTLFLPLWNVYCIT